MKTDYAASCPTGPRRPLACFALASIALAWTNVAPAPAAQAERVRSFNTDASGTSNCDYKGLGGAIIRAIDGRVDFKRYSHIQIVMPGDGACTSGGVANVGSRTLSSRGDGTLNGSMARQMASSVASRGSGMQPGTDEMGHNPGMSHSSSRDFGAEALGSVGSAGTPSEYGDMPKRRAPWSR